MKNITTQTQKNILNAIRKIPDFPKKGILFYDITTLLNDKKELNSLLDHLQSRYEKKQIDFIAGIESRGFIFAAMLCGRLNLPFIPIRKPKKLPFKTFSCTYDLEYGSDQLEIHQDAFKGKKGAKVLLVDDLIATGGTALAAYELIEKAGGVLIESCFFMSLKELKGQEKLEKFASVYSVLEL